MSNLIGRVQNILLTPKTEWPVIAAEPETVGGLYTKYILLVSALGPVAMFLRYSVFGVGVPFVGTYRMGMGAGIGMAVSSYVLGLIAVFLFSLIINVLAPTFGGQKDGVQALKAAAYAATAPAIRRPSGPFGWDRSGYPTRLQEVAANVTNGGTIAGLA